MKENTPKEYKGKRYTTYEALQRQRRLETTLRAQRQEIKLLEQGHASEDDVLAAKARYFKTSHEYAEFSKEMGLPQQRERVTVDNLGTIRNTPKTSENIPSLSSRNSSETVEKSVESDIINNEITHIRNAVIPQLKTDTIASRQAIHKQGTEMFNERKLQLEAKGQFGPSYVTISDDEIIKLVDRYKGTGVIKVNRNKLTWNNQETILNNDRIIGVCVNNRNGVSVDTSVFRIHYSKKGIHIVPDYPSKKKVH